MKSFWDESIKEKNKFSKVENDINTSVCIIGGGLTGLSCGYYLSKNTDVIIVEKNEICSSTSGKNTGKVTSQHGLFYKYLTDSYGKEFAKKYLEANEQAINNIEDIINKEGIECEFKREFSAVYTSYDENMFKIKEEEKAVSKIEKDKCEIIKNPQLPINVKIEIAFKNQAKINPVKYGYGLANAITKNNGKIFEHSTVTDIKQISGGYEVLVNNNKIIADKVIIATRYPTIKIPGYYFLKMYQSTSYAIVTDVKEEIFEGMYISIDTQVTSFRVIEENGKKLLLAVGYDYKTGTEQITNGYNDLEKVVKKMYPQAEILYRWSAEDCITLDKIPYIGEYSNIMKNLYIAVGFNKWGITTSNIAGNILADKINGVENKYEEIFKSTRLNPIKNKDEMKNMLVEVKDSLILSKFSLPKQTIDNIKDGEGKIINIDGEKIGVYKAEDGKIYKVKPICTHLGCELYFNNNDKTWECPCHGSKFNYDGKMIEVPAIKDLKSE